MRAVTRLIWLTSLLTLALHHFKVKIKYSSVFIKATKCQAKKYLDGTKADCIVQHIKLR